MEGRKEFKICHYYALLVDVYIGTTSIEKTVATSIKIMNVHTL